MQVKSWVDFFMIIWSFGLRWGRMSMVELSDAGQVMARFFQNHMVLWFKVRSYVDG